MLAKVSARTIKLLQEMTEKLAYYRASEESENAANPSEVTETAIKNLRKLEFRAAKLIIRINKDQTRHRISYDPRDYACDTDVPKPKYARGMGVLASQLQIGQSILCGTMQEVWAIRKALYRRQRKSKYEAEPDGGYRLWRIL